MASDGRGKKECLKKRLREKGKGREGKEADGKQIFKMKRRRRRRSGKEKFMASGGRKSWRRKSRVGGGRFGYVNSFCRSTTCTRARARQAFTYYIRARTHERTRPSFLVFSRDPFSPCTLNLPRIRPTGLFVGFLFFLRSPFRSFSLIVLTARHRLTFPVSAPPRTPLSWTPLHPLSCKAEVKKPVCFFIAGRPLGGGEGRRRRLRKAVRVP